MSRASDSNCCTIAGNVVGSQLKRQGTGERYCPRNIEGLARTSKPPSGHRYGIPSQRNVQIRPVRLGAQPCRRPDCSAFDQRCPSSPWISIPAALYHQPVASRSLHRKVLVAYSPPLVPQGERVQGGIKTGRQTLEIDEARCRDQSSDAP